jgi:hypothetical protein
MNQLFKDGFGALNKPSVHHTLPISGYHMIVNAFKGDISLKPLHFEQQLKFKHQ